MDHVAIMKKTLGFLPKILSGEKTIESRWYQTKRAPWGKIKVGNTVYFKNSGELVTARATVSRVLQFENLTPKKTAAILKEYGPQIGLSKIGEPKKYCILVFLENPQSVKPIEVDKTGFGSMSAWLTGPSRRLFRSS